MSESRKRLHERAGPKLNKAAPGREVGKPSAEKRVPRPGGPPGARPSLSEIRERILERARSHPAHPAAPGRPKTEKNAGRIPHPNRHGPTNGPHAKRAPSMRVRPHGPGGPHKGAPHAGPKVRTRFPEAYRAGHLDRLTKGNVARDIKLAEQYRMHQKGDVARRLGLHKHMGKPGHAPHVRSGPHVSAHVTLGHGRPGHGPHSSQWHVGHHYRGRIHPTYAHRSSWHHYYGPSYWPHYCRYPSWTHWVSWSWRFHCHPLWDPRPVWCRPIVYVAAPRWVSWELPVWDPLPVVTSGTWVDVEPAKVGPQYDLQMLAIRFVDPGHPEEQLGPRYRVWFRNNSASTLNEPFDVLLLASDGTSVTAEIPQAGVRVTSVEPSQVQSVDIRLPFEVYALGTDAEGQPKPFTTLHAVVDAGRRVDETNEANNGVKLARDEILPIDPAAFEVEPTTAPAGGEVVLAGEGLGPEPGQVLVHLGGIEMEAEILGWYDLGVSLKLPELPLAAPTQAELIVVRGDGAAANPLQITIAP